MVVASAGAADYAVLGNNSNPQARELNQGQALVWPMGSHKWLIVYRTAAELQDVMMMPTTAMM